MSTAICPLSLVLMVAHMKFAPGLCHQTWHVPCNQRISRDRALVRASQLYTETLTSLHKMPAASRIQELHTLHIYVHVDVDVNVYVYAYVCMCMHVYTYMRTCVYICIYIHTCIYVHAVCMYVCMYACMHVCMHVCLLHRCK